MRDVLHHLLIADTETPKWEGVRAFLRANAAAATSLGRPIDRAILGGFVAGCVGFGVAAGHQAALRALLPDLAPDSVVAFCASEEGGAHPRSIRSTLAADAAGVRRLNGRKRWATLAPSASGLLVVASTGWSEAKNDLRLVLVPADRRGIAIEPMPTTSFTPEIEHAEITFDDVEVSDDELRLGDAYRDAVKPFRTLEDLFIHAALLAHLLRIARHWQWPESVREELLALVVLARGLARLDVGSADLHLALAGLFNLTRRVVDRNETLWQAVEEPTRTEWQRDSGVLGVAGKARELRRQRAWRETGAE